MGETSPLSYRRTLWWPKRPRPSWFRGLGRLHDDEAKLVQNKLMLLISHMLGMVIIDRYAYHAKDLHSFMWSSNLSTSIAFGSPNVSIQRITELLFLSNILVVRSSALNKLIIEPDALTPCQMLKPNRQHRWREFIKQHMLLPFYPMH